MWRRARSETSTAGGALAREGSTATLRLSPRLVNYTWWHRRGCRIKGDRRQKTGVRSQENWRKASLQIPHFKSVDEKRIAARTFRDLVVWKKAHQFALCLYTLTADFPKHETYGLSIQMRRAAVSIPANIAEGFRKRGLLDKARYMNVAEGSLEESRYYLILAKDLGYSETIEAMKSLEEVSRLLHASSRALRRSSSELLMRSS